MPWIEVKPVIDSKMRGLCVKPYPLHPKGCPNFNKKHGCPPQAPHFKNNYSSVYAIYNIFDFKAHTDKMRLKHKDWSERQVRCVLYWQGTARKALRREIKSFLRQHRDYKIIGCPEAQGVNLTETMKNSGIILEWPPVNISYQIILAVKN